MLNKNNLKHMLILALSFFGCSYIYLVQSMILKQNSTIEFANEISVLYGSFAMALGILLFSLIYRKTSNIRKYYILFMFLYMLSIIVFFNSNNIAIMSICLCSSCLFGSAGFGAGYNYSLIASNVEKKYQGRVYAFGYALGSILTQIITIFSSYVYNSFFCILINIVVLCIVIYFVCNVEKLEICNYVRIIGSVKKYIIIITIIIIAMGGLSSISQDIIGFKTFENDYWFADTRLYYSAGLIIAGVLYDKRRKSFDILLLISFVYQLFSVILVYQNISPLFLSGLSYFLISFFSLFRAFAFINLAKSKESLLFIAGYGLMFERIIEGCIAIVQHHLMNNILLSMIISTTFLSISLWLYFSFYLKKNNMSSSDIIKELSLKSGLSIQEEKVLNLIIQDLSNQEMADKLYLSINTIRNHVANIYKKTGMNKKELREKCFFGTD